MGRRQEDYINANIHLYNNVQAGDKSVKFTFMLYKDIMHNELAYNLELKI